jgi:hypothetical protein
MTERGAEDDQSARWSTTSTAVGSQTHREWKGTEGVHQTAPKYLKNDRKVLRFFSFFKEGVAESQQEGARVRDATILYYLTDDTIEILEPRSLNSGIPQGCFLKRMKLFSNALQRDYTETDLHISSNFEVYGRVFKIYDCDNFTRDYFVEEHGCELPPADPALIAIAKDPYTEKRDAIAKAGGGDADGNYGARKNDMKNFMEANLGNPPQNGEAKARFLANARKVLSFALEFENRDRLYGDLERFTLNFFLEDNSVEVKEKKVANSGKDNFPLLLHRAKLPINWHTEIDNDRDRADETNYVSPEMLLVGSYVDVYGRHLKIVDCDQFTRKWYSDNGKMQMPSCVTAPEVAPAIPVKVAPYNGYGTEEDSMVSCHKLTLKAPHKDMRKFIAHSQDVLRFRAKPITDKANDASRTFIIAYYVGDDTIAVFEPPQRNSGTMGGKFLQRGTYKSPGGIRYTPEMLVPGTTPTFSAVSFNVQECDAFTKKFMGLSGTGPANQEVETKFGKVNLKSSTSRADGVAVVDMSGLGATAYLQESAEGLAA